MAASKTERESQWLQISIGPNGQPPRSGNFQCITGTEYDDPLTDLLCDLMHWSDREDIDFHNALDTARLHYETECEESEEENPKDCKPAVRSKNAAKTSPKPRSTQILRHSQNNSLKQQNFRLKLRQNQAIGTALPLEDLLSQARALADEAKKRNARPVRPFVLYSLRHTFLTRLGQSGCDIWTLARIAGHAAINISARYVHPSEDAVLEAMSRLGGHKIGHTQNDVPQLAVAKDVASAVQ